MSIVTWGLLHKNMEDPEKIEQAIARLIEAHNDNPEAHLGEGQSLQSHKMSEVIDHLARSIIADKLADGSVKGPSIDNKRSLIKPPFDVADSWDSWWSGTPQIEFWAGMLLIRTGAVDGNIAVVGSTPGWVERINYSTRWLWQVTLSISHNTNIDLTFGFCNSNSFNGDYDGVFFRYVDGQLSAGLGYNGGDEMIQSAGSVSVGSDAFHVYRIEYDPETEDTYFYVDGVEVAHFWASGIQGNTTGIASFELKTTTNEARHIIVIDGLIDVGYPGS